MGLVPEVAAQAAEIGYLAVVPEQGVDRGKIKTVDNVEGRANSRPAGRLTVVVDRYGESVGVVLVGGELSDAAVFPYHRLVLEHLILSLGGVIGWAGGIPSRGLRVAGHDASIVDRTSRPVVAAERCEGSHRTVLPQKAQTCRARPRSSRSIESAEVFTVRVGVRGFGLTHHLAGRIGRAKSRAVQPPERAEIPLRPALPEDRVPVSVRQARLPAGHTLAGHVKGLAVGSAQWAEVDNLVARLGILPSRQSCRQHQQAEHTQRNNQR